uniref:Uncharacterized protein n=1 Tax=Rhizophora mucronata TaxID=61149 RepID=A0A2P2LQ73_RHIMU
MRFSFLRLCWMCVGSAEYSSLHGSYKKLPEVVMSSMLLAGRHRLEHTKAAVIC